jgi:alkylated DNA repair protein (DNA oxidative demethylase)
MAAPSTTTGDLFAGLPAAPATEVLGPGSRVLRGFATEAAGTLIEAVAGIARSAPFRHLVTPGGHRMSVATTSCGRVGWYSDRRGYRYTPLDPETDRPWPAMPEPFIALARAAAAEAGFAGYRPDACLINRYEPGAKMSLHQDRDEEDRLAPIVSVSLGIPALFQFGGFARGDRPVKVPLQHGDVVVWGGPDRMRYHGVLTVRANAHPLTGAARINLTFRAVFRNAP